MRRLLTSGVIALFAMLPHAALAAPKPVSLPAIEHTPAELTVIAPDGTETRYAPGQLETLPTYSLQTTTPWRSQPANFEGVLLRDLLEAHGPADAEAISVTAENDYRVAIPREIWLDLDVLVATRVDGAAHSRRARGPIQFVIDMDSYSSHSAAREDHLVWMAARIEAAKS
ncbi:molybdopterin-dependent oxidoreductase [Marimonas sp. MJW-29]|uniref:Molybdopterin-dependent oxidoreductase n=1 Tax=Sulfitobacter sediminis TaxID=3234186 RepID=A0ABV3RGE7_9RHOB